MPPGIFKMINGSKFMRYHHDGAAGASRRPRARHPARPMSWAAARRSMRRSICAADRPTTTNGTQLLRGDNDYAGLELGRRAAALSRHGGQQPAHNERHGADGPAARLRPRPYRRCVALVRAERAGAGRAVQPRLQRAEPARRRLLPVHEPARQTQQRGLCLHRAAARRPASRRSACMPRVSRIADRERRAPSASSTAIRRDGAARLRRWRGHPGRRRAGHAASC